MSQSEYRCMKKNSHLITAYDQIQAVQYVSDDLMLELASSYYYIVCMFQ